MRNYLIIFLLFFLTSCNEDIPGQLTPVQGKVTDYLTGETLTNIPLIIASRESHCFCDCEYIKIDTVFSDYLGFYNYELYNDSAQLYFIVVSPPEDYAYISEKMIRIGKTNTFDFNLKQFIKVYLKLRNTNDSYNSISISNFAISQYRSQILYNNQLSSSELISCIKEDCDTILHVIPDDSCFFKITLYMDSTLSNYKDNSFHFVAGNKDTTFIYYY